MRIRLTLALAGSVLAVAPAGAVAAPAGYTHFLSGRTAAGGSWELAAKRGRLQGHKGVCLNLEETFPDGSGPGSGGGCAYGSLSAVGNVMPIATSAKSGATMTSFLVGGIVTSRARTVKIRFGDGTRIRLRTHAVPRRFHTLLGQHVRAYGASVLGRTHARMRYTTGYDRHGHKVAGHR